MKTKKFFSIVLLFFSFLLFPILTKATPPPSLLKIATSLSSGSWNNPTIWSNGKIPDDSTFVIIQSGHNVNLVSNSSCESLVIEQNASLDNDTFKLTIQFMDWAHGIVHSGTDDGVSYFGYAPIDNTWSINNPNNGNWNIYKVDGVHSGTGDIVFSFWDYLQTSANSYGMTLSGSGLVTNTGNMYIENINGGGQYIKFNSACNLTLSCNVKLIEDNNTILYGGGNLNGENFGKINLKGNADFIATNYNGTFTNYSNSSITLENGAFYANPLLMNSYSYLCYILNSGLIHVQNGNLYMPDGSIIQNMDSIVINGDILGASLPSTNSSIFMQGAQNCVLTVTGEIFPTTYNTGILIASGAGVEPNYVVYNGIGNQNIFVPSDPNDPYNTSITGPYSILSLENSNTKTLLGDIEINDSLLISGSAIFNTSSNSYGIKMNNSSVWKNTGVDVNPFVENNSLVTFSGSNIQNILCTVSGGETFYDLAINNASGVVLNGTDINVTDTLSLLSGVVSTGINKLSLNNTISGSLASFSSTSFVNGNFRRNIWSNTETYSFPVGNGTSSSQYFRADVLNNNLSGVTYIDANVNSIVEAGNNIDAQLSTFQDNNPITDVNNASIWNLNPDAQPISGSYGVKLYTENIAGLIDNMFFTVKRPYSSTDYVDWDTYTATTTIPTLNSPGRTIASGYAERTGLTSFSEFAIGSVSTLTTSIDASLNKTKEYTIYPIPASDYINIDLEKEPSGNIVIELTDMLGNKISEATLTGTNLYRINRNDIPNGIYILNVIIDQHVSTKKIVFQ